MKQNKNIYYYFISQKNKLKGVMHQTYKPKMSNKVRDIDMKKIHTLLFSMILSN